MKARPRRLNVEKTRAGLQIVAPWAAGVMDTSGRTGRLTPGQADVSKGPLFTADEEAAKREAATRQTSLKDDKDSGAG